MMNNQADKHSRFTNLIHRLAFVAVSVAFLNPVPADAVTFYARANGDWDDLMTWSLVSAGGPPCGCTPSATDDVVIDGFMVDLDAADEWVNSVTIKNAIPGNTHLRVENGRTLTVITNVLAEAQNQPAHVDLYVTGLNSKLVVMGNVTFNRLFANLQVERLRLQLTDNAELTVAGDFTFTYQNANVAETCTEITLQNSSSVSVTGNANLSLSSGRNLGFDLINSSQFNITGNLTIDHTGGSDIEISIDNAASMNITGNAEVNLDGGSDNVILLGNSPGSSASLSVSGNLILDHNGLMAGDNMYVQLFETSNLIVGGSLTLDCNDILADRLYIEANSNSEVSVTSDINFIGSAAGQVEIILNNDANLNIGGNLTRPPFPDNFGSLTSNDNSTVTFNGSAPQMIPQEWGMLGDNVHLNNVVFNNSYAVSPQFNMEGPQTVYGTLTLIDGVVQLGPCHLFFDFGATVSGGSINSYIDATMLAGGYVQRLVNALGSYAFPIGDADEYTPITVTLNAGTTFMGAMDAFRVQVMDIAHPMSIPPDYITRYWMLDSDGFISINYNVSYYYTDADIVGDENIFVSSIWNGMWTDYDPANVALNNLFTTAGILLPPHKDNFANGRNTPLPIELVHFDAVPTGNKVEVNWTTASEINNEFFTVERSFDGATFERLGSVSGAGISYSPIDYSYTDHHPGTGISYYRLTQTDRDGTEKTFTPVSVKIEQHTSDVKVYPNPARVGQELKLQMEDFGENRDILVVLLDHLGREVYSKVLITEVDGVLSGIDLSNKLQAGVYFIIASSDHDVYKQKLVITSNPQNSSIVMK